MNKETLLLQIVEYLAQENIVELRYNKREITGKFSDGVIVTVPISNEPQTNPNYTLIPETNLKTEIHQTHTLL